MSRLDVVVVGGAGHIGLPLSLRLAESGKRVGILDTSVAALAQIEAGHVPFREAGAAELLKRLLPTGRLEFAAQPEIAEGVPIIIVVIGTPLDEFMNPSMAPFSRVIDELASHLAPDALVILRSTVVPGTTTHIERTLAASGHDVRVAFCPERTVEGHALAEITSLPQIVGADDETAGDRAERLFVEMGASTIRTTAAEAEYAKLFTNAWRYIKFAAANEFFTIADAAGQDYGRILGAMRTDYPRAADLPNPGFAAGPCLLKDTMQLAASTAQRFRLGHAAREINEGLPDYVVAAMERRWGSLADTVVGILGMAFKAESDDTRASLSYKLRKLLLRRGAIVLCTDPYVQDERCDELAHVVEQADILVVGAPHAAYRDLDVAGKPLIDVWGASSTQRTK